MKAAVLTQFGEPENLVVQEVPTPSIGEHEVLVRVRAASINPVDMKTRQGKAFASQLKDHQPLILGWDISGEVAEVGASVHTFQRGDTVFGMVNFPGYGAAYAEYVAAPAAHLAHKPANITHEEAAAATLAALTAWQAVVDKAQLQAGQKILIHAAAGGVGHFAVQLAKHLGAYVIGTSSAANRDFVLSLGADEHIDYTAQRFEDVVADADVVLVTTLADTTKDRSVDALKPGGTLVSILSGLSGESAEKAAAKGIRVEAFLVASNGEQMQRLADLLETGALRSEVSLAVPVEQIPEAHRQIETGKTRGKIVVTF
ncbi:NADP-dependent oxidoreductase [Nibrella saemangeumensis]|uniref:NADP-dependent oxidoreductase n=1 Tax=Nibrella saemangeumensis TaxID=1084526 RepID=A0ABP8NMS7_9BACT